MAGHADFCREAGFPFLCTDLYPFFSDKNPNGPNPATVSRNWYRTQVATRSRRGWRAARHWIMPQMFADIWGPWKYDAQGEMTILPGGVLHWRGPTVGETRWQTWSALGLGAQGIIYYVHESPVSDNAREKPYQGKTFPASLKATEEQALHMGGGLIHPDGSATAQYEALGQTFAQVRKLLPVLQGARPLDISARAGERAGLGRAAADPAEESLAVVVNDDTDKAQDLKLTGEIERVQDLRTGKRLKLDWTRQSRCTWRPAMGRCCRCRAHGSQVPDALRAFR